MSRQKKPRRSLPRGKNLVYTDDYIINQHGVKIPLADAKKFQNDARAVNAKRSRQIKSFEAAIEEAAKNNPNLKNQILMNSVMGKEMDMAIAKRSTSLNQFTSPQQFRAAMRSNERARSTDYEVVRGRQYKRNLLESIDRNFAQFPELTKGIKMRIRMMNPKDFGSFVAAHPIFEIRYQYLESGKINHLNDMREYLGLKVDDTYMDEMTEEYLDNY